MCLAISQPANDVPPANAQIATTRSVSIMSTLGIVLQGLLASPAFFFLQYLMKLLLSLCVTVKKTGSDFRMSHFLPAIKTIIPICLENCRLTFMTDRAGDKDVEGIIC
jgi:hypothetical protein